MSCQGSGLSLTASGSLAVLQIWWQKRVEGMHVAWHSRMAAIQAGKLSDVGDRGNFSKQRSERHLFLACVRMGW